MAVTARKSSTHDAFAAIVADGKVVTWGKADTGDDQFMYI
jgi:hypothetical protein